MNTNYIPKMGISGIGMSEGTNPFRNTFGSSMLNAQISNGPTGNMALESLPGMGSVGHVGGTSSVHGNSFKNVLNNTLQTVNETMAAPDVLMQQAMTTGNVDVHDVMIANAKSELVINIAAQMTTKVIQAYDRILQIQI